LPYRKKELGEELAQKGCYHGREESPTDSLYRPRRGRNGWGEVSKNESSPKFFIETARGRLDCSERRYANSFTLLFLRGFKGNGQKRKGHGEGERAYAQCRVTRPEGGKGGANQGRGRKKKEERRFGPRTNFPLLG